MNPEYLLNQNNAHLLVPKELECLCLCQGVYLLLGYATALPLTLREAPILTEVIEFLALTNTNYNINSIPLS